LHGLTGTQNYVAKYNSALTFQSANSVSGSTNSFSNIVTCMGGEGGRLSLNGEVWFVTDSTLTVILYSGGSFNGVMFNDGSAISDITTVDDIQSRDNNLFLFLTKDDNSMVFAVKINHDLSMAYSKSLDNASSTYY